MYKADMYQKDIFSINYDKLKKIGIKVLVYDLDNTIIEKKKNVIDDKVKKLFNKLKKDFKIIIISNTWNKKKIEYVSDELDVSYIMNARKPFKYGYKKMWIEYDGIVTVGIDFEKVQIEKPDVNSTVRIYVPDAQVFDVDADEDSMSDPFTKTGKFTKITVEEKADAFSAAQATMRTNAESDNNILTQAKNNAKELIKQYVINVGKQIGKEYKVEWIDESKTNSKEKGD